MSERPNLVGALAQRLAEGILLGAFLGVVTGGLEYLRLRGAFSSTQAHAYWNILVPHLVLGAAAGLAAAAALSAVLGVAVAPAVALGRLLAALVGSGTFVALAVWATYWLGLPVLRPANLAAYVACGAIGLGVGLGLDRAFRPLVARLEGRGRRTAGPRTRAGVPLALAAVTGVVLFLPGLYLGRATPVAPVSAGPVSIEAKAGRPNVLFILIDALRADHLPAYGYSRETAPTLSTLAREGLVFTQAYASASYTRASIATLFSSLYPSVHKANEGQDYLPSSIKVVPELLRSAGYATFGISSNANVSPTFGYSRGFDEFRVWKTESEFRLTVAGKVAERLLGSSRLSRVLGESRELVPTADAITDGALAWAQRTTRQPFFMYVHYIDPHDPYSPPPPYDRAFDHRAAPPRRNGVDPLSLVPPGHDPERLGRVLDQYDGEILFADHHVGRLLAGLEERGLLDNTLVIVTADHGEEFFDHGNEIHGRSAYEEVIRVPFLVHWKGVVGAGRRFPGIVGLIDVMPTLLDLAGVPAPPEAQGTSLVPVLRSADAPWPARTFLAQVINKTTTIEAIRDGQHKLIRHVRGTQAGQEELYDLEADPLERRNVAAEAPARVAAMRRVLDAFNQVLARASQGVRAEQAEKLDRDTERALRSLGYIK
jgi:arylsulfatase A-like enzyme